jgi:hypothetical protein
MLELAGKEVFRKMAAMVDYAAMDLLLERHIRGEMEVVDVTVGRVQMVSLDWLAATACQVRTYLLHLHIVFVVVQAAVRKPARFNSVLV